METLIENGTCRLLENGRIIEIVAGSWDVESGGFLMYTDHQVGSIRVNKE